jgi:hypothetical protein
MTLPADIMGRSSEDRHSAAAISDETTSLIVVTTNSSSSGGSNQHENSSSSYGAVHDAFVDDHVDDDTAEPRTTTSNNDEETTAETPPVDLQVTREEEEGSAVDGEENRDGAIGTLTRRLRCLFSTITWPIVPLGTIVALALLWVLYAASSLDLRRSCSHPLHWYALASLILVAYIPHHAQVRSHLFHYSRERDGPIRPARVRMYDQFFHTICLLYVYTGVTLIQTCREDIISNDSVTDILDAPDMQIPPDIPLNSCAATCPNLYQALSVYVATLEMFTFALILPLCFLPCIYLWFLRRATAEAEAFAQLQDRLQEEEALLSHGGVTATEILDSLENVKLVSRTQTDEAGKSERQVWLLPSSASQASIGMNSDVKECCICMSEFPVQNEADLEDGLFENDDDDESLDNPASSSSSSSSSSTPQSPTSSEQLLLRGIVRTRCGHVFHKECLAGWVGGRWQMNPQAAASAAAANEQDTTQDRRRRRARQTCCPLCREDLRPTTTAA